MDIDNRLFGGPPQHQIDVALLHHGNFISHIPQVSLKPRNMTSIWLENLFNWSSSSKLELCVTAYLIDAPSGTKIIPTLSKRRRPASPAIKTLPSVN